jgi:signal transduction histidine kinase
VRHDVVATCSATEVVAERVEFWSALAADEGRPVEVDLTSEPVPVRVGADDLAACLDALLGNVFAHTPEGCGMRVSLARRAGGGGVLVVSDDGPGMPDPSSLRRGHSGSGSTGLGLDIVRRVAAGSGGSLTAGTAPGGGTTFTVELGAPPPGTS